jgi:chromosome segregation ATPase
MMTSTLTSAMSSGLSHSVPASWSALPNLRAFSWTEGLRLSLIVGSLSFVILAGQFAHSRNQELSEAAARSIVNASRTHSAQAVVIHTHHRVTASERYARTQIQNFSELLDGLTERAEIVLSTVRAADSESANLKTSLQKLDEDLMTAREALVRFQKTSDRFSEEDLRESVLALQDSASRAQGQLVSLDQPDQGFKVSRIGQ